jgi:WD40-like Beta Propeller Repeat
MSHRQCLECPWSTPTNLGQNVNSASDDATASLSADGRTLLFDSVRPGGAGGRDIWMVTRTVNGK